MTDGREDSCDKPYGHSCRTAMSRGVCSNAVEKDRNGARKVLGIDIGAELAPLCANARVR